MIRVVWPLTLFMTVAAGPAATQPAPNIAHKELARLAWQLAVPTGALVGRTVFEALDLFHPLTVHHVELTPGQPMSPDHPDVLVRHDMPAAQVAALLAKLKSMHMDVVSYGPVDVGHDAATDRAVFAFAKQLNAKDVVAVSPPASALERLDRLATEFGVNLAIRNGPVGFRTASDVSAAIAGRSKRVGNCDDLGAWAGAGDDALAATRALDVHVVEVRVDVATSSRPALSELRRQGFKGVFVVDPGRTDVPGLVRAMNGFSSDVTAVAGQPTTR
jgi:hypothetical protein